MDSVKLNFVSNLKHGALAALLQPSVKKERLMSANGFALKNSKHILVSTDTFTPKPTGCSAIVLCWRDIPKMHDG